MAKHRDVLQVLLLVLVGMFVPFLGSIALTYGLEIEKIGLTFVYFVALFGVELFIVFLYFTVTSRYATKHLEEFKQK
jgi:Zn-dependent protease with chaperone function